jgi:hypothetical protein
MSGNLVSFEVMRTVLREIATENSSFEGGRVRFIDRSDDPNDPWIKLTAGPYKTTTHKGHETHCYINWTIWKSYFVNNVATPDDGWVQSFKADLLKVPRKQRYRPRESFRDDDEEPTWASIPTL